MANQHNEEYQLGETIEINFDLNDAAVQDIDLTGAIVEFMLALGDLPIITMSTEDSPSGISIDSPTIGTGSIIITPAEQLNLVPDVYNYEIKATLADQVETVQIFGRVTFLASLFAWTTSNETTGTL